MVRARPSYYSATISEAGIDGVVLLVPGLIVGVGVGMKSREEWGEVRVSSNRKVSDVF
jgi:hypothetical protein